MAKSERVTSASASLDTPRPDRSLATQAYLELKRAIIRCELEPGQRITERELVGRTNIGKTPVREALARLVQEGLVRNLPRHSYEVTSITLVEVQELFGLRLVVEPAAAQLAAGHVDVALLRRLDELCRSGYELGNADSADAFLAANHEIHSAIARASGNRRLAAVVETVLDGSERLFHLGLRIRNRTEQMAHEHRDLVDALVAGDGESARRITIDQVAAAQRMVVDALIASPSFLTTPITAPAALPRPLRKKRTATAPKR